MMRELHIVLPTVGIVMLRNGAHSQHIHRVTDPGAVADGEVGWTPRLLAGLLKCYCHQRSVACTTVSQSLGTQSVHVTIKRVPSG